MAQGRRWAIPDDFDPEEGQWRMALFCIPDSPKWRGLIRAHINDLTYGRNWDERTGSILSVLDIAREIDASFDMTCGEDIKRIADVLEDWYDAEFISLSDFEGLLEAAGLEDYAKILDWAGEWVQILGLLDLPNIKIPIGTMITNMLSSFYRGRSLDKHNATNTALRAIAIGQSGPNASTFIDNVMAEIPLENLRDLILGKLDEIVGITGPQIEALITGNYVTEKLDDIQNTVNGGLPPQFFNVVRSLDTMTALCGKCGKSPCGCGGGYGEIEDPPADPPGDPETDPPPEGFPDWPSYDTNKCGAANKLADDIIATYGNMVTLAMARTSINQNALAAFINAGLGGGILAGWLAHAYGVATAPALVIAEIIAMVLAGENLFEYFPDLADELEADKEAVVCDLYNAGDVDTARAGLQTWLYEAAGRVSLEAEHEGYQAFWLDKAVNIVNGLLVYNVLNRLFKPDSEAAEYEGTVDCSDCLSSCDLQFAISGDGNADHGTGDLTIDGTIRTLSSVYDPTPGYHYIAFHVGDGDIQGPCGPTAGCANQSYMLEVHDVTGDIQEGGTHAWICAGETLDLVWSNVTIVADQTPVQISRLEVIAEDAFTMDVRLSVITAPPPPENQALNLDFDEGDFSDFDSVTTDTTNGHVIVVDSSAEL